MNFLDLTNLTCPWTIITTKQALEPLPEGATLLIKVNDPSFIVDCQVYAKRAGHKLNSTWNEGEDTFFLLEK